MGNLPYGVWIKGLVGVVGNPRNQNPWTSIHDGPVNGESTFTREACSLRISATFGLEGKSVVRIF